MGRITTIYGFAIVASLIQTNQAGIGIDVLLEHDIDAPAVCQGGVSIRSAPLRLTSTLGGALPVAGSISSMVLRGSTSALSFSYSPRVLGRLRFDVPSSPLYFPSNHCCQRAACRLTPSNRPERSVSAP